MIPILLAAGHRVIAPDLVGFGRSDKPTEQADYSYARHVAWMSELVFDKLQLRHITFFGQDWGGLIGLRLVTAEPERFDRVVAGNTGLPIGRKADFSANDAFMQWRNFSQTTPTFPVGTIVNGGSLKALSPTEVAAYDAPFPDETYKSGARIFPTFVPVTIDDVSNRDNEIAWGVLRKFEKPFLCTFSDQDPVTAGGEKAFMRDVPGAANQPHVTIKDAGHFLQENKGEELANIMVEFIANNPR
jgi:haloalkane dehalogenase